MEENEYHDTCPLCETRKRLKAAEEILDASPTISADFYDDALADVLNEIDNAISTFRCMCDEPLPFSIPSEVDLSEAEIRQ